LGYPVLLGASRKSFIARLDPAAKAADARLPGSLAAALAGALAGVAAVRVHDVAETVQALKVWAAIEAAR
jgi:dihydropteroate synthase